MEVSRFLTLSLPFCELSFCESTYFKSPRALLLQTQSPRTRPPRMRLWGISLFLVLFHWPTGTALALADLAALRDWTADDGRTIEARVLEIDADKRTVRMARADNFRFEIEWARFAADDQALLQSAADRKVSPDAQAAEPTGNDSNETAAKLPVSFALKKVPMVKQKGNFCVPASASMIAGFHGLETDQDEVARLSSAMSAGNQGTYPSDMLLAMQKLGFSGSIVRWQESGEFHERILPTIRRTLVETGPIYISFKPGVFGPAGHGCVIVGYDDRREELHFYNPWGEEFEKSYSRVAIDGYGLVFIDPPKPAPVATEALVERVRAALPRFDGDFLEISAQLKRHGQANELIWCSRRDARSDKRFARDTARDDGRKILELAFERNPAVLIPHSVGGRTEKCYFVTRPPEGGARFQVHTIDKSGWSGPELKTLGRLTRHWVTEFTVAGQSGKVWELPMIELHPQSD